MVVLGIDPGKTGAAALMSKEGIIELIDWSDGPTMARKLMEWQFIYAPKAALEKVSAMPKQGVVSMFNLGANYGWWQGALEALKIPYKLVRPQEWQKAAKLPKKKKPSDKPSLPVARQMFPDAELNLAKHHGRADALLIADWLMNH
jgi:hypothetical protein